MLSKFKILILISFSLLQLNSAYALLVLKNGVNFGQIVNVEDSENGITFTLMNRTESQRILDEMKRPDEPMVREYLKYFWQGSDIRKLPSEQSVKSRIDQTIEHCLAANTQIIQDSSNSFSNVDSITYAIFDNSAVSPGSAAAAGSAAADPVGYISLQEETRNPQIHGPGQNHKENIYALTLLITPNKTGNKLGTRATSSMIKLVREKFDVLEIFWDCHLENMPSWKIAQKNNFEFKLLYGYSDVIDHSAIPWIIFRLDLSSRLGVAPLVIPVVDGASSGEAAAPS
ncbi:MAG: GNAT family N-acetyltransferase [Oligoflexia bacterium]|nr:GNAT family N-acetyltransferase [Oligoflexia bacterium]